MAFLDFLFSYLDHLAQQRRAASAAQAQQVPAQRFAAAWNATGGIEPLRATVQDPVRGPVTYFPVCDAAMSDDDTHLYMALTVSPDAPISTDDIAANAEAVRQAVRAFFQVAVRPTGMDVRQRVVSFVFEPVRPVLDSSGAALVGYSSSGRPLYMPFIGEVTALTGDGDDLYVPWVGAAYGGIEHRAVEPSVAVSSTEAAARQARHGAVPAPLLVALGDAICPEDKRPVRMDSDALALSRRGVVMWSRGDVESDGWYLRPTQTIHCDGDMCVVQKNGRSLRFTPAWAY